MAKETKILKVHLIFAPTTFSLNQGDLGKGQDPPLGILYIASYLRKYGLKNVEIKVTDGLLLGLKKTILEALKSKADVFGISVVTPNAKGAYILANEIKAHLPCSKIVFGGPHPTAFPGEPFQKSKADIAVVGEGEATFNELIALYTAGKDTPQSLMQIDGICFQLNGSVHRTKPRLFIQDLDTIPFPARDLVHMDRYSGWMLSKTGKSTAVLISRGCPFKCTYCSNNVWRSSTPPFRSRSPENVIAELKELRSVYRIKEFFDNSDEFNTNLKYSKTLLKQIIAELPDIYFQCQVRATPMDDELARLMKKAGVWYLHLGIESGNEVTLKGIRKKITLSQVEQCCRTLKKYDIKIWGLFMYFNIWERNGKLCFEDYEMSLNTLNYAKRLYKEKLIDFFGGSITTPIPGSELWDIALRHDLIKENCLGDWDKWFYKRKLSLVSHLPGVAEASIFRLHQKTIKYTAMALLWNRLINPANLRIIMVRILYFLKREGLMVLKKFFRLLA